MGWWIIFSVFSTALYIGVVAFMLPRVFLRDKYKRVDKLQDRGVVRYRMGEDGRGIAYQPSYSAQEYVQQYVIAYDGKEKIMKCKLSKPIDYIEYDIVLYSNENKPFKALSVRDVVAGAGYTRPVVLPSETAYASLTVVKVDDKRLRKHVKLRIPFFGLLAYSALTMMLSIFTAFALKLGMVNIFGGVYAESFMKELGGHAATLRLSVGLAVFGVLVMIIGLAIKNSSNKKAGN